MTARLERSARRTEIRRELLEILSLAFPMMAAQGGLMLMGVVDTLFLGRVSSLEMAAASLGNSVLGVILVFNVGMAMGIEPLVSQAIGAGEEVRARAWLWQGLYLTGIVAVPITAVSAASTLLLEPAGIPHELATRATAFLFARLPGMLFFTGAYSTFRSYFACIGKPRPVLYAVSLANLLNTLADYVFVFGRFGMPKLGAVGAGLATSTSICFMALFLGFAVRASPIVTEAGPSAGFVRPRLLDMAVIAKLGWPIGLQISAEVGIFTLASIMIGRLGEVQLAGHQVAITIASLSYMAAVGIANATTARVGFFVGAGDAPKARRAGFLGILAGGAFMGCCGATYLLLRQTLAALFAPTDPAAQAVGATLLAIAAAFSIFDGVQTVSAGALRGTGDTKWPFYSNIAAYWFVALPLGLYLGLVVDLQSVGYWWGLTAGLAGVALILLWRFSVLSRRSIARVST